MKKALKTQLAPQAIGPYSQAILAGELLFISGMLPLVPETMKLVEGDAGAQARQVMGNLCGLLSAQGLGMESLVKTTIYLKSLEDFAQVNEVYAAHFAGDPPARACVEVSRLPKDALVEIEAIAAL